MKKEEQKLNVEDVNRIISLNFDARNYFFSKADEKILDWLWKNGILDKIKKKSDDPTRYSYRMPELDYLARMAEKVPEKVTDIMLAVPISADNFNPEVVDRFLWISSKLPAEQLERMAPKIHDEKWVSLMGPLNHLGFEYEKILATLSEAKDSKSILIVAETVLALRNTEGNEKNSDITGGNRFLLGDLAYTKVFEYITKVDNGYIEKALHLMLTTLVNAVCYPSTDQDDGGNFKVRETFHLYGFDFFTIELDERQHYSYRDDVRDIAASVKILLDRVISGKCSDANYVRKIYEENIKNLPDSWSMWRLRLYTICLCPKVFKEEIKEEVFRIFKYDTPGDFLSGAEYERLIQIGLPTLEEPDQRTYVAKAITWFKEKDWKDSGRHILSSAFSVLKPEEKQIATEAFGQLDENYVPQASVGISRAGTVVPRPPGAEEQWKKPVSDIVQLFKSEWSPEALKKNPEHEDFFHPIDAEGARDRLKSEMEARPSEFIEASLLFFDRTNLSAHYTYSFLRNLSDLIREKKIPAGTNLDKALLLLETITNSGIEQPFEKRSEGKKDWYWVGDWDSVNHAMPDLINGLLGVGVNQPPIDFIACRDRLFMVIKYLLSIDDPEPKDEKIETAKHRTKSPDDKDYMIGDPFTTAINSVRGRAFQALVTFAYLDGKKFSKETKSKIDADIKTLYEEILKKEKTRAIMFMFGHYLATFYFADIEWVQGLLPKIFPDDAKNIHLYLAAWEGYLARNLYEEMFFDPQIQKLYEKGLTLTGEEDLPRKYFRELDEGISTHLALAFMHYEDFGFEHPLFKAFWADGIKKQAEFVSFIGRSFISGNNASADKLLSTEPTSRQRLKELWDWILKNCSDVKIFDNFGFWISLEKDIFDATWLASHVRQTLEKSKGALDWEYGLEKTVDDLAKVSPQDVLAIANLYFLDGGIRSKSPQRHMRFRVEDKWYEAFEILSKNPATKAGISSLISVLIRDGGSPFWNLEPLLKQSKSAS